MKVTLFKKKRAAVTDTEAAPAPSNKKTKLRLLLFWIAAFIPPIGLDILLRYNNPGTHYNIIYHILSIGFTLFWASVIVFACTLFPKRRVGRIIYTVIMSILSFWFFANYIYFDVTGQYLFLNSIVMFGEGVKYAGIVGSHISPIVFIALAVYILCFIAVWRLWPELTLTRKKKIKALIFPFAGILIFNGFIFTWRTLGRSIGAWEPWGQIPYIYKEFKDTPQCMNVAGFYQYTFKSLFDSVLPKNEYSKDDEDVAMEYFAQLPEPADNEMTGVFAGKNVILVLLESIDDWMIDERYTPTMKHMMDNGINFTDNYTPTRGTGFTFSSEFCVNTGFYCPTTRSSAAVFTEKPFVLSMPNLFRASGYCARSFHYNSGEFYNRLSMHEQFGYESYNSFMEYLTYKESILDSEAAANDDIFDLLVNTGDPERPLFFDYVISYSAHLPYKDDDLKSKLMRKKYPDMFDETIDSEIAYAKLFAHDTDEFFRILLEKLKSAGLLENTVIAAFADHYAYGVEDRSALEAASIEAGSSVLEKTPLFIYCASGPKTEVTKPTSTCDIMPTLLNLMGVQRTKYLIGHDAFAPDNTGFVFYANNSWYDGRIYYNTDAPPQISDMSEDMQEYISTTNDYVKKLNKINNYAVESGFYSEYHADQGSDTGNTDTQTEDDAQPQLEDNGSATAAEDAP